MHSPAQSAYLEPHEAAEDRTIAAKRDLALLRDALRALEAANIAGQSLYSSPITIRLRAAIAKAVR